jgi:hypothetical protein
MAATVLPTNQPATSPLGVGLACTYCSVTLPMPGGTTQIFTIVQPSFGMGTDPNTGYLIPETVSGRTLLIHALIRRISCKRGTLPDVVIPTNKGRYGVDVLDFANADMPDEDIGQMAAAIDDQFRQDERVVTSTTTATLSNNVLTITSLVQDATGPFRLTFAANLLTQNLTLLSSF